MKRLHFDILVVGAGPAGLAATTSAARSRSSIGLIDDNPTPGGQLWRGGLRSVPTEQDRRWFACTVASNVTLLSNTKVIAPLASDRLLVETATESYEIHFARLVLATGARELFLPFPGWTLPGVMGAGGLQALVKGGLPIKGKRVVVAGSGPLLLAVAAYLKGKGAHIQAIVEQAPWTKLGLFTLNLPRYSGHLGQARKLGWQIRGVPLRVGCWVSQAHGTHRLESVTLCHNGKTSTVICDYLACGFGLVPNIELPIALGCKVVNGAVWVNGWQQSGLEHVYCAGEVTGVGGLDVSLIEGQIAGLAATEQLAEARTCIPARDRAYRFASLLARSFALRPTLKTLADDTTMVCRCEDVPYREVKQYSSWRSAKLYSRCGMGPCQGRVCGAATAFLFGWTQDSVRPPVTAARVASLAQMDVDADQHRSEEVKR